MISPSPPVAKEATAFLEWLVRGTLDADKFPAEVRKELLQLRTKRRKPIWRIPSWIPASCVRKLEELRKFYSGGGFHSGGESSLLVLALIVSDRRLEATWQLVGELSAEHQTEFLSYCEHLFSQWEFDRNRYQGSRQLNEAIEACNALRNALQGLEGGVESNQSDQADGSPTKPTWVIGLLPKSLTLTYWAEERNPILAIPESPDFDIDRFVDTPAGREFVKEPPIVPRGPRPFLTAIAPARIDPGLFFYSPTAVQWIDELEDYLRSHIDGPDSRLPTKVRQKTAQRTYVVRALSRFMVEHFNRPHHVHVAELTNVILCLDPDDEVGAEAVQQIVASVRK